jgi:hypothetical protein
MSFLRKLSPALFERDQSEVKPPPPKKWTSAYSSHRFYCLVTHSGYRSSAIDLDGENILLPPDCSDGELGNALSKALAASRMFSLKDYGPFFDANAVVARHKQWVADLMRRYQLKTKKALFTDMNLCNVTQEGGMISISPNVHDRLEGWGRRKSMNLPTITVAANANASEIGAALRGAFSYCR